MTLQLNKILVRKKNDDLKNILEEASVTVIQMFKQDIVLLPKYRCIEHYPIGARGYTFILLNDRSYYYSYTVHCYIPAVDPRFALSLMLPKGLCTRSYSRYTYKKELPSLHQAWMSST